jgi:aubergine-like protein
LKNGEEKSFKEYYRKYGVEIRDLRQPLLVSRPKQRDINRGEPDAILLIPEFCALTGQTSILKD